ncbi:hypothetical protein ACHAXR_002939 [Thalassiosira sp. AJA248-18]
MSVQTICIPKIDVGTPSEVYLSHKTYKAYEAVDVCFHGFENLPVTRGACVHSPEFACFGHQWRILLFPGGATHSDYGMVSIYIENRSDHDENITVQFGINVKNKKGKGSNRECSGIKQFVPHNKGKGGRNFTRRSSDIIKNLIDGSLIIGVRLRQTEASGPPTIPFIAENPLPKTILEKFMDEDSSDVVFEVVSSESAASGPKRTKTSTTFYAHRFILQDWPPALGELCKSGGSITPIPISDVKPDIFRHMLYYSYGGKVASGNLKANAKEIIDAADKYGVVGLKLEAEASLVTSTSITIENAMDNLLYADAKNCALLKEAVMDFLVENGNEAVKKLSFDDVPGSVVKDLLTAMNRGKSNVNGSKDETDFSTARVNMLRKMLHEKGLDIDGSREAMVARLEENSSVENVA